MLNQCKDYDDCGCVVGRVALASIEGEVLMSVYSSCDAHAPLSRNVELCSDFNYKNRGDLRVATTAQNFCIAVRMQCHTFPPHGNFAAVQPRLQDGLSIAGGF